MRLSYRVAIYVTNLAIGNAILLVFAEGRISAFSMVAHLITSVTAIVLIRVALRYLNDRRNLRDIVFAVSMLSFMVPTVYSFAMLSWAAISTNEPAGILWALPGAVIGSALTFYVWVPMAVLNGALFWFYVKKIPANQAL